MPDTMHRRKGIMGDFAELPDEQRIERLEALARAALAEYGLPGATLTHRSDLENAVFEMLDRPAPPRLCPLPDKVADGASPFSVDRSLEAPGSGCNLCF
jgi:hypothetical protein